MAKELPYFKFEPNQWENGNIQICNREDKGLFMDLCSMYWSRLGDLPLKLAIQKLCAGNALAFNSLIEENIFQVIEGFISIEFLNEQLEEFDTTSKKNSKNALLGWEKRREIKVLSDSNATASNSQSKSKAIREEKRREEERKEEKINILLKKESKTKKFDFKKAMLNYGFSETLVIEWLAVRKTKRATNTETAFESFISEFEKRENNKDEMLKIMVTNSWSGFKYSWVDNLKQQNDAKTENGKPQQLASGKKAYQFSAERAIEAVTSSN